VSRQQTDALWRTAPNWPAPHCCWTAARTVRTQPK